MEESRVAPLCGSAAGQRPVVQNSVDVARSEESYLRNLWSGPSALGSCLRMQTRGFTPGWYEDAPSALRVLTGMASKGRRPGSYQPGATRQVTDARTVARAVSPLHSRLRGGLIKPDLVRGGNRQIQTWDGFQGPKARFIPAWRSAPGYGRQNSREGCKPAS